MKKLCDMENVSNTFILNILAMKSSKNLAEDT